LVPVPFPARAGGRGAAAALAFGDFDLTPPRLPLVLSITDDIRLEVSLVANQAPA
jgi:hypothetical protein